MSNPSKPGKSHPWRRYNRAACESSEAVTKSSSKRSTELQKKTRQAKRLKRRQQ